MRGSGDGNSCYAVAGLGCGINWIPTLNAKMGPTSLLQPKSSVAASKHHLVKVSFIQISQPVYSLDNRLTFTMPCSSCRSVYDKMRISLPLTERWIHHCHLSSPPPPPLYLCLVFIYRNGYTVHRWSRFIPNCLIKCFNKAKTRTIRLMPTFLMHQSSTASNIYGKTQCLIMNLNWVI